MAYKVCEKRKGNVFSKNSCESSLYETVEQASII